MREPIIPITPRKLATPVNDTATGIFEDICIISYRVYLAAV
jgi:hypothetical protein